MPGEMKVASPPVPVLAPAVATKPKAKKIKEPKAPKEKVKEPKAPKVPKVLKAKVPKVAKAVKPPKAVKPTMCKGSYPYATKGHVADENCISDACGFCCNKYGTRDDCEAHGDDDE